MVGFASGALFDLLPLRALGAEVITQSLGFRQSQRLHHGAAALARAESAFAGLWRVLRVADDGTLLVDRLECGPIPAVLGEMMLASAADSLDPRLPAGVMNAEAWWRKSAVKLPAGSLAATPHRQSHPAAGERRRPRHPLRLAGSSEVSISRGYGTVASPAHG